MDLYVQTFPRFGKFPAIIYLNKLCPFFPFFFLWILNYSNICFFMELCRSHMLVFLFFKKNLWYFLFFVLFQNSYLLSYLLFLSCGLFCYIYSLLHFLSHSLNSSARKFLSVLFYNFNVFVKNVYYSYILFLISLNCLSEFSCNSLRFFMAALLNSLSVRFQFSMHLSLVGG